MLATEPGAIPPHLDKFIEVSLKHLEFSTTMCTLLLGAVAYVVTKHYLEKKAADRPGVFWFFPPVFCALVALITTLRAYTRVENALLASRPLDIGVWWQTYELIIFGMLIAGAVSLCALYAAIGRK